MDINIIRGIATLLALLAFLGVVWWAYSGKNKERFEEDALLPFADDVSEAPTSGDGMK